LDDRRHTDDGDGTEGGDVSRAGAGYDEHPDEDGAEHEVGAEVGLQIDQRHRHCSQAEHRGQTATVEVAAVGRAIRRHTHDQCELGPLGRLQLEAPELKPGLGAACARPDRREDEEQEEEGADEDERSDVT
jgi:hypothetical protein